MSERQKKHYERKRESGMVRINVWVHESRRQELHAAVKKLQAPKDAPQFI